MARAGRDPRARGCDRGRARDHALQRRPHGARRPHALQILDPIGNANAKGEYYLTDAVDDRREQRPDGVASSKPRRTKCAASTPGATRRSRGGDAAAPARRRRWSRRDADRAGDGVPRRPTPSSAATSWSSLRRVRPGRRGRGRRGDPLLLASVRACRQEGVGRALCAAAARRGARRRREIGNFVETKAADDRRRRQGQPPDLYRRRAVGANANIGAGTITCNYDGFDKHRHRDRRGRLRRLELGAGRAGEDRRRRLCRLGLGDHRGRAGGCAARSGAPAGHQGRLGEALARDEDARKAAKSAK